MCFANCRFGNVRLENVRRVGIVVDKKPAGIRFKPMKHSFNRFFGICCFAGGPEYFENFDKSSVDFELSRLHPQHGFVFVSESVGLLNGGFCLADSSQPTNGMANDRGFVRVQAGPDFCEIPIATDEEPIRVERNVPQSSLPASGLTCHILRQAT